MKEFFRALKTAWLTLSGIVAFVAGIAGLLQWLKPDALQVITALVGFQILITGFLVWVLIRVIERGFRELKVTIKGQQSGGAHGNPGHSISLSQQKDEGKEKEPKPSGAGAFAGMVAGAALGLPFGPPGVFIGGIIGALVGNQAEYDNLKKRRQQ